MGTVIRKIHETIEADLHDWCGFCRSRPGCHPVKQVTPIHQQDDQGVTVTRDWTETERTACEGCWPLIVLKDGPGLAERLLLLNPTGVGLAPVGAHSVDELLTQVQITSQPAARPVDPEEAPEPMTP